MRPLDTSVAADSEYEKVGPAVETLLGDVGRCAAIGRGAADYFDRHASPERVAEHMLATLRERLE